MHRSLFTFAILVLAAVLLAATPAAAQSKKLVQKKHPCCSEGKATGWPLYNQGVKWADSLADAQAAAREQRRPILLHVLVGDMNREGT